LWAKILAALTDFIILFVVPLCENRYCSLFLQSSYLNEQYEMAAGSCVLYERLKHYGLFCVKCGRICCSKPKKRGYTANHVVVHFS